MSQTLWGGQNFIIMEIIRNVSDIIQLLINEIGTIMITLIGVIGIAKLLINQFKELIKKED